MRGFRVWYKNESRWLKDSEFKINPDGSMSTYGVFTAPKHLVRCDDTGLHDKNGKEIYEGDVLEVENNPNQTQKARLIGVVSFSSWGTWEIEIKKVVVWRGYRQGIEPPKSLFFLNIIDMLDYRIIGNIHENPELLSAFMASP